MIASRTPMDFETLSKGDSLSPSELEAILHVSEGSKEYAFKVMALQQQITEAFRQSGQRVTVAMVKGSLRVLTDPEASEYNAKRFRKSLRTVAETHERMCAVDVGQLSREERDEHERQVFRQGHILTAITQARKELGVKPVQRTTPRIGAA